MSVLASAVTVTSAATVVAVGDRDGDEVIVSNTSDSDVFVGDSLVTVASGFPVAAGATISFRLAPNAGVFGIVSGADAEVRVLKVGN